ncbi:glycoside hydrolase family 30 protein [Formosa algae]|uniref:Glucosylceramidase n=3 Tax=Formosa algae TaxID=225843 RepID=A0A9X0YNS1_9FLAO|nr:glucosylceramidase [Formosa algae]MDQ0336775.1 glucosylceramidase [Formosa algae]
MKFKHTKKHLSVIAFTLLILSCTSNKKETEPLKRETMETPANISYTDKNVVVYTTAKDTNLRLTQTNNLTFVKSDQPSEAEVSVFVNPNKTFQEFLGIGGAITDASAEVFAKLRPETQEELLQAYFTKDGIGYNIIRTSIHSCDFSSGSYTYIDEGDAELTSFSIAHDKEFRIPMIKKAAALIQDDLIFYASPWSPPAFMKTNNDMLHGGKLLPEYNQAWANYYVKFIEAYEAEGLPVWGLTIQNEPMAVQIWESCIYTAEEERDFLKNYLGPTLEKAGMADKNIVVWDHNRDLLSHRANTIFEDPEAAKYAWGIGFHWYETWAGGDPMYDNLNNVQESFPTKNSLFTEGCNEGFTQEKYQYWPNAERYGNSMINDFNNGVTGWTDWNILLDENGGPNHVGNLCFAPIHADTKTGELIYTPAYYYIGHFSKFIHPKAKRVSTTTSRSTIESTTFKNIDGTMVTVVMNKTDHAIKYNFIVNDTQVALEILPHALQTLVY